MVKAKKVKKQNGNGEPGVGGNIPARNILSRGPASVSQHMRRTLSWGYVPSTGVIPAGSFVEAQTIVLNGPYDPDVSVGGTSAHGFAKYMAFYSKCFVLAARITVKGVNESALAAMFGLTITTFTTPFVAAVSAIENGYTQYKPVGTSPNTYEFSLGVDVKKFLDKTDVLDDPQLFCTDSSNPTQIICGHFWVSNYNSATACATSYSIEVEYDCVFTDPVVFA